MPGSATTASWCCSPTRTGTAGTTGWCTRDSPGRPRRCRRPGRHGPGRFALQAAIAGLHVSAPTWETTDWARVVTLYDALLLRWPSPIVALNRAAARSLVPGADLARVLGELDELGGEPALASYSYLPAARADVLSRLGRPAEASAAYDEAIALTSNETERRFLSHRRAALH